MDIEQMIMEKMVAAGGTSDQAAALIVAIGELAERKGLNADALLLVTLDSCSSSFTPDALLKQLRINCGEFGK